MAELNEIIAKYNLTSEGKKHFGVVEGYQALIKFDKLGTPACVGSIGAYLKGNENDINSFLEKNKKELGLFSYKVNTTGIIWVNKCFTVKKGLENLEKTLLALINYLKEIGIDGNLCPNCGKPMEEKTLIDSSIYLCKECSDKLNEERAKTEEEYQNAPNNYLKGTLGALGGAAIGGIAWIVVGLLGFVSALIAILIGYLAGLGYDLLKGKQNKTKILVVSLVSFGVIIISYFVMYSLVVKDLFYQLANDSELLTEFMLNMFLGLVFGALGIGYIIYNMKRKIHK